MKKFYLGALGCLLAMGASAQSFNTVGSLPILDDEMGLVLSIPTELAYQGKSAPYSISSFDEDGIEFSIYNKSFGVNRTIKLEGPTTYSRTEIEEREAVYTDTEVDRMSCVTKHDDDGWQSYPEWWIENKSESTTCTDEYVEEWIDYKATQEWQFQYYRNIVNKEYGDGTLFVTDYEQEHEIYDGEQESWVSVVYYIAFYFKDNTLLMVYYYPKFDSIEENDDTYSFCDEYASFCKMQSAEYTQDNIKEYINTSQTYYNYGYFSDYNVTSIEEENGTVTFYTDAENGDYRLRFEWDKENNNIELVCIERQTSYTGEWVKSTEKEEYDGEDYIYDAIMYSMTIGQPGYTYNDFAIATQTLFNNDEKWEFIRPIYSQVVRENYYDDNEQDRDGDGEIDYKYTEYSDQLVGYEIVSEDGSVLATLTVEENDYCNPAIVIWDEDVYFATVIENVIERDEWGDYEYETFIVLYAIDRNTTNINRVNATAPAMRVSPALANRNSTINVTLDGEAAARGGELIITDANGRTIGRNRVAAGQTSTTVSTNRMTSGAYNITLTDKGEKVDNARIIVK